MEEPNQPGHVVVAYLLVLYFLRVECHAKRVLDLQLEASLGELVPVDLVVQPSGLDDCAIVAQVEAIVLFELVQVGKAKQAH